MSYGGRTSSGQVAIAVCARCNMKHPYPQLSGDRDKGVALRVCPEDNDERDPWRMPAPPPDAMTLRFPRPDVPIPTTPAGIINEPVQYASVSSEDGESVVEPG